MALEVAPEARQRAGRVVVWPRRVGEAVPRARAVWTTREAISLVVLGGLILRLDLVGFGNHSLTFQPDEEANLLHALSLSWHDLNPHAFYYPGLFWYLLFALYQVVFWLGKEFAVFTSWSDLKRLFTGDGALLLFLLGRTLSVALGTATVALVYRLGSRLFSPAHGLMAAGFLAATFLHVRDSALATLDAPLTFFVVLSLLGAAAVLHEGRYRDYLLAGAAAGLATATKYNGVLVLVSLLVAHGLREARAGRPLRRIVTAPRLMAAGLLGAAIFLAANPYLLLDRPQAWNDLVWEWNYVHTAEYLDVGPGWQYHLTVSLRYGMGVALLALGLAGTARAIWRRDPGGLLLLGFALPFFLAMATLHAVFVRYMTPLLPVLCLLAASVLVSLCLRLPWPRARVATMAALSLLVVLEPLHAGVAYGRLVHRVDTRIQTRDFVETSFPPGTQYVTYGPSVTWRSTIPRFLPNLYAKHPAQTWDEALQLLRTREVSYVIAHYSDLDVFSPTILELEQALHHLTVVREFTPYEPGPAPHPVYDRVDAHFFPIGRFAGVRRPGPLVRVYRLD
jgi:4-amino-4-deoxy-L-arabinose transferase-like glycosyltransferase